MEAKPETESKQTPKVESLNVMCGICNEFYREDDNIISTSSCGHVFHKECLIRWLSRSSSCPQCRATCHRQRIHRIYLNFRERTDIDDDMQRPQIQWLPMDLEDPSSPTVFNGAVKCGTDHEGFDTYVARLYLHEDLLPANYVQEKRSVYAPWNCRSHHLNTDVDLLVLTDCDINWVPGENGSVPANALKTGYSELGETLFTGRALHQGYTILGKVHPSHRVLYMPFAREEINSSTYEVLVVTPKEKVEH